MRDAGQDLRPVPSVPHRPGMRARVRVGVGVGTIIFADAAGQVARHAFMGTMPWPGTKLRSAIFVEEIYNFARTKRAARRKPLILLCFVQLAWTLLSNRMWVISRG